MSVKAEVRTVGNVSIVDLSGRITLGEGSGLVRNTIKELVNSGHTKIIVNLKEVTYIDSAGLAAFIEGMQKVEAYGGKFALAGLQETVRSIFEISRLDQVFRIFPDVDAALDAA